MSNDDVNSATVRLGEDRNPVRIHLAGSVGAFHSDELYFACLSAVERSGAVEVACAAVTHLGGTTIQMLLGVDRALGEHGHRLRFVEVPDPIAALLRDAGLPAWAPAGGH